MEFFPVFLKLQSQPCLLVGGGESALRKARLLARAGAALTVVAPELCQGLHAFLKLNNGRYLAESFSERHLEGVRLVVAATGSEEDLRVAEAASARGIWVNIVDDLEHSSYITPAIVDRSPLVIALSSGGTVPMLARLMRARLESLIPAGWGKVAQFAATFRKRVRARFDDDGERRQFWESVLRGPIAEDVFVGNLERARLEMERRLDVAAETVPRGAVYLVGVGPGTADLLTFRALHLMQKADVVLYDRLGAEALLDWVRRDAERIFVGKSRSNHALDQAEINALMVKLAQEGKQVLRLKGGDPFIFGRGGEEIETLAAHGIPFEVVPGVTAASGASAYAGIPLTHRDYAQSVVFVTGHRQDGSIALDWPMLTRPGQTVVIYMGVGTAREICQALIAHGRSAACPAAVVEQAATARQRVGIATLETLPSEIERMKIGSPALIIVGEVVNLAGKLAWFHPRDGGEPDTIDATGPLL